MTTARTQPKRLTRAQLAVLKRAANNGTPYSFFDSRVFVEQFGSVTQTMRTLIAELEAHRAAERRTKQKP